MARQITITQDKLDLIKENAEAGIPEKHIAQILHIPKPTWYYWKRRAKEAALKEEKDLTKNDKIYLEFLTYLESGYSNRVKKSVLKIVDNDSWTAQLAWLERFDPDSFGKKVPFDPEGFSQWMRDRGYPEEARDKIYSILESYNVERGSEIQEHNTNESSNGDSDSAGESAFSEPVDAVPSPQSTVPPEQRNSKLETTGTDN